MSKVLDRPGAPADHLPKGGGVLLGNAPRTVPFEPGGAYLLDNEWDIGVPGKTKRLPILSGGAGPTPPNTPATPVIDPFLRYARTQPLPVQVGSIPAGNVGGQAQSFVAWNPNNIPEVPAWCSEIDLIVSLPVSLTIPAGKSVTVSPWAPYSAFAVQMILAGSPEWPANCSLVPFWLDELTTAENFDPMGVGPLTVADFDTNSSGKITSWYDRGPAATAPSFGTGSTTLLPGQTVTNGGGGAETLHFVMNFVSRIRYQRKRTKMWGMIPLGDPQNRPVLKLQLSSLIGPNPENSLIQDSSPASGATAAVDTAGVTVYAVFRSKSLDVLPQTVQQMQQPMVQLGLNVTYDNSFQIQNAGAILYQYQRTAQIYNTIFHGFVNGNNPASPIDVDYFGLWLTQNQASARWSYDASAGTMQDYFSDLFHRYKRYLPKGVFVVDLDNGQVPEIPRETPYNGLMSPDTAYAAAAGVAATPNMATAFRIPAGTAMSGAYAAIWTLGLVRVPY
jgi:hypothetical protein